MIINLPTKGTGIQAISQWQTFLRWRRKPAGTDMDRNFVTVTLCGLYITVQRNQSPATTSLTHLHRTLTTLSYKTVLRTGI